MRPRSTRRGYRNWCPVMINALITVETVLKSSLRYGESDKNNNLEINFNFFNSEYASYHWDEVCVLEG
jgi:hypothetical protein